MPAKPKAERIAHKPDDAGEVKAGEVKAGARNYEDAPLRLDDVLKIPLPQSISPEMPIAPPVVESVIGILSRASALGHGSNSQAELARAIRERLPLSALTGLAEAGLSDQEIERLVIPSRTRRHRVEKNRPLTVEESDRVVRLLRILTVAVDTFGDKEKAGVWLRRPLAELSGETPLAFAETEAGARVIETILAKIAWGAAA
jgi:putative toxin-antitoxin system antitoxin component (TIGR02293 family)